MNERASTDIHRAQHQITDACLRVLEDLRCCRVEFVPEADCLPVERPGLRPYRPDGLLRLESGGRRLELIVEVKSRLSPQLEPLVLSQAKDVTGAGRKFVLFADYVSPPMAERLREAGVHFVDAAGNAYLTGPGLHIDIRGRKGERIKSTGNALSQVSGLKLAFALLARPEAADWPQRRLAEEAGVALGSVGRALDWLARHDHLLRANDGRLRLADRAALYERWRQGYAETLRPRLRPGRYRFVGGGGLSDLAECLADLPGGQVLLGGDLAAALCIENYGPKEASLHLPAGVAGKTAAALRLARDPQGPVFFIERFGTADAWRDAPPFPGLAHPLLIHAELSLAADSRAEDAARAFAAKYLDLKGRDAGRP